MSDQLLNINQWIEDNKDAFLPPVCNKMMQTKQLKVFYVGGPNQRKDFHLEEGEELFYMKTGDMELVVLEQGSFRSVVIREGEVFLLPGKIPHSPQRNQNTMGLVIERERAQQELDCLRYYVEGTTESLFERWFYCDDLGVQLGPVIKEFFASEQCRTGRPIPGTIPENPPYVPDAQRKLEDPFPLKKWIDDNLDELNNNPGFKRLFSRENYQSDVLVYGTGETEIEALPYETWLWQFGGQSTVAIDGEILVLNQDDSLLIPPGKNYKLTRELDGSFVVSVSMETPATIKV